MAKEIKRLYRLDNRVIAGVCAGIAEYYDVDPAVVRILAVLLFLSSFGIVALLYILLWLVMPRRLNMADSISCDVRLQTGSANSAYGASASQASLESQDSLQTEQDADNASYGAAYMNKTAEHTNHTTQTTDITRYEAVAHVGKVDTEYHDSYDSIGRPTRMLVWLGILLLSVGFTGLCSAAIEEVRWWQMWPCFVILGGVAIMALPSPYTTSFMDRFFCGIVILAVGLFLLLITTHILLWPTVLVMFERLWQILIMILGVGIISCALKSRPLAWVVALCIVVMLVVGVALYAVPGPLNYLTVHMPFVGVQVFDVNPWI